MSRSRAAAPPPRRSCRPSAGCLRCWGRPDGLSLLPDQVAQAQKQILWSRPDLDGGVIPLWPVQAKRGVVGKADPLLGNAQEVLMHAAGVRIVVVGLDGVLARRRLDFHDRLAL